MTYEELGQKVKAKYPDYSAMSDSDVGQKVAAKYPEYQSQIDEQVPSNVGGFLTTPFGGSRPAFTGKGNPFVGPVGQAAGVARRNPEVVGGMTGEVSPVPY